MPALRRDLLPHAPEQPPVRTTRPDDNLTSQGGVCAEYDKSSGCAFIYDFTFTFIRRFRRLG